MTDALLFSLAVIVWVGSMTVLCGYLYSWSEAGRRRRMRRRMSTREGDSR